MGRSVQSPPPPGTVGNITPANVLALTVEGAWDFFADAPAVCRSLKVLREAGLNYIRLGQPVTELSGGKAQRVKLATELQRSHRCGALLVPDEPTGLHPSDVERLLTQLNALVDAGNTVIVADQDMSLAAASDWVIDVGPEQARTEERSSRVDRLQPLQTQRRAVQRSS